MRFNSLLVSNLRAVRRFEVAQLKDFIVVAGQNGSGKSCVFDAMRLLKSIYGGYAANEYHQWFGEFAINLQDRNALRRLFRDPAQQIEITAEIEFAQSEADYMIANGGDLIWPVAWQRVTGQPMDYWSFSRTAILTQLVGPNRQATEAMVETLWAELRVALESPTHTISVRIDPAGNMIREDCLPAEVSFQAYKPDALGVIEYHSASRSYSRQPVGGINLDVRAFEDQRRQQTLYNQHAKYQNVKTELATGYLRNLIAAESGERLEAEDLNETLKELFKTFFPDKEYEGVRPMSEGSLEFPVRLPGGEVHDIDDLSSGEKEILYGYLRLRNSTPRRSVILLDEPELHLNPGLLQGFADFYHRHLGVAQENQLWLVTHSDTLLRQAIGNSNYRVYHMLTATTATGNQASEVILDNDVERVVVDLVGDLAAYRPHAKVVILEGKSEDAFDEMFIRRLFPDFAKRVNLVSAGNKRRVRDLYAALEESAQQVGMQNRFFAIVDRDAEGFRDGENTAQEFVWDVYHVENYLLVPAVLRSACRSLAGVEVFASDEDVWKSLQEIAESLINRLVLEEVQEAVNQELVGAINVGGAPTASDVADALAPSIAGSVSRVAEIGERYREESLATLVDDARAELDSVFGAGEWSKRFPGRLILRLFVDKYLAGVGYEPFRNVVIDKMVQAEYRPESVRTVLQAILEA